VTSTWPTDGRAVPTWLSLLPEPILALSFMSDVPVRR
jgi:hypothetical protein